MVQFSKLAFAMVAVSGMVEGLQYEMKRYSDDSCSADHQVGHSNVLDDVTAHDNEDDHCLSFGKATTFTGSRKPRFHSFDLRVIHHPKDADDKDCSVVVYGERDCKGESISYNNLAEAKGRCASIPFGGKSVIVRCVDKPQQPGMTSQMDIRPATSIVTSTLDEVTPVSATETVMTTITVSPVQRVASQGCSDDTDSDDE